MHDPFAWNRYFANERKFQITDEFGNMEMNSGRRITQILILVSLVFLAGNEVLPQQRTLSSGPRDFDKLAEDYYEEVLKLNPLQASSIGDNRYNDRLAIDIGEDYRRQEKTIAEKYRAALN